MLLVVHDPLRNGFGSGTVREYFGWNDPEALAEAYIADLAECSYGYVRYRIVEAIYLDEFPLKVDGFRYDAKGYLRAWRERRFHEPDTLDYLFLVESLELVRRVARRQIDEVWLMGHPYTGYYESVMAGPGAFWCNGPPVPGTAGAGRRFVIMGFNYERGVGEMLEDFGHRAEAILARVFAGRKGPANLWQRFIRTDRTHPGRAECGTVHEAPNSERPYDWGNMRPVPSYCDAWLSFPSLSAPPRLVDAREWGGGDIRQHHRWWLSHLPHVSGSSDGIAHNWWQYVVDPNRVL